MIEQIKNAFASVPSGAYTLLAPLLLAIGTSFAKNKKIKELQDIAERNIKLLKEVPEGSKIHAPLEDLVVLNLEEIKQESTRSRDWNSFFVSLAVVVLGVVSGFYAWRLWGDGWVASTGSVVLWLLAATFVFGGLGEVWKAWRGEVKKTEP